MEKELYDLFKKAHPETVGETDKEYDRYNYMEWLEKHAKSLINKVSDLESDYEKMNKSLQEYEKQFTDELIKNRNLKSRINEIERRHSIIMSEPNDIIRSTMIADFLID